MRIVQAVVLSAALCPLLRSEVRVWQGTFSLPTYEEGQPDVNPPFDAFASVRFNYPYTLREQLTDHRKIQDWRAAFLENEYLRCVVLPDIGGHLYSCTDKTNGAELFYANPSIKKVQVAYRGAWAAFGVEFNFPVSHNWVTVSPVDFALRQNPDGSASVWVANIDRVYGMQWRVELILRPGSTVLEQRVRLYNPGALRRRFYWWNNAGVQGWDDSRIYYPQNFSATHGFTFVDRWPVNSEGLDQSRIGDHVRGFVSQFAHATREPYMGVYHPHSQAGTVHFAWPSDAPGKKLWSWGADAEGKAWRRALSDNESTYVEVQSGLFRNQETYAFLSPQETIEFSEYWMPVREIGGIARANLHAVVNFEHGPEVRLGMNVTHAVENGLVRVLDGARVVAEDRLSLDPARTYFKTLPAGPAYTVELRDAKGNLLLAHTEGQYDMAKPSEIAVGPQPGHEFPPPERQSEGDYLEIGVDHELNGRNLVAWDTYQAGLQRFPDSFELHKAAGRLAVTLLRYDEAREHLLRAQQRRNNDPDLHYHLGIVYNSLRQTAKARAEWERAAFFRAYRAPARLELAFLDAQEDHFASALDWVEKAIADSPDAVRLGAAEVALLRHAGNSVLARERLAHWRQLDPTNSALRFESTLLGGADETLWSHLAADPDRVLVVASEYLRLGLFADALALLDRRYPAVDPAWAEPGAVLPQQHPLIAYYRGYSRERLGQSGLEDYRAAAELPTRYVFPNRADTVPVLRAALAANPGDASAHFLLGSLWMSGGMLDQAIAEWEQARRIRPAIATLHRNLGYAVLLLKGDPQRAAVILREGLSADPTNIALFTGLDQALTLLGRPPAERGAVLAAYPDRAGMPQALVYAMAVALAEGGQFEQARRLFFDRFFALEEFGTNVVQVYLEVELLRARALLRDGKVADARRALQDLDREVPGLPFTSGGLTPFLEAPRYQYQMGELAAELGDRDLAQTHWRKASGSQSDPPWQQAAFVLMASKRLGAEDPQARERRLQAALRNVEVALTTTGSPGMAHYTKGVLLRELGRTEEARKAFRTAVLTRDRGLSQYLGRVGLASLIP